MAEEGGERRQMEIAEVAGILEELPEIRVSVVADRVTAYVPALHDTVRIDVAKVRQCRRIWAPNGDPAIELSIGDKQAAWPLLVASDQVGYRPVNSQDVLDSLIEYRITNAPHIVAYTEMQDAAIQVALACERPGRIDLDKVGATLLLVRCQIVAATRAGMRPVLSVAWWQKAWAAIGGDVPLPPFRVDPVWDDLAQAASQIPEWALKRGRRGVAERPRLATQVTIADFRQLEPGLTAVGLNDEFVSCWQDFMPITPVQFTEIMLEHLDKAHVDISLYPNGSGSADVIMSDGGVSAILQLSWSSKEELHIDEVRIPQEMKHSGLFRQMMRNIEHLARMIGFECLAVFATGEGSVAFARAGFNWDIRRNRR